MNELDSMDVASLRALVHHQQTLLERLLREREGHLVAVEQAFRRRHNEQRAEIEKLERLVQSLTDKRKKAS